MSWFGRRARRRSRTDVSADVTGTAIPPDPALPMFPDGPTAARFVALARQVFAEHGLECTYSAGVLAGADGHQYGLTNVAQSAARSPVTQWRRLLTEHVGVIRSIGSAPEVRDLERVRDRLFLRLWEVGAIPGRPDRGEWLGDRLVGLPAIDHPEHVETLAGTSGVEQLGGWPTVRDVALQNLSRLRADAVAPIGDGVHLSLGGVFNASRVLTMESLLRSDLLVEPPVPGVLFAVPQWRLVALHRLSGPDFDPALDRLAALARSEYDAVGAISPDVWFWRDGQVQQVTSHQDGELVVHVEGAFARALGELGWSDPEAGH